MTAERTRIPPYNEDAERSLLGAALHSGADPMLFICAEVGIDPDSFYLPAHRTLMASIVDMHQRGHHVDLVTLRHHLRDAGQLEHCGGTVYLDQLLDSCMTPAYAQHYAEIVANQSKLRNVIDAGRRMVDDAYAGDTNPESIAASGVEALMHLSAGESKVTPASIRQSLHAKWDATHSGKPSGLSMPWKELERRCGGPPEGLLSLVVADKGSGKSTMFGQWCHHLAKTDQMPVGIAPFEDGTQRFFGRMGCFDAGLSYFAAEQGRMTPDQLKMAKHGVDVVTALPIQFTHRRMTLGEFEAWAVRIVSKYGVKAIFADALKDFRMPGRGNEDDIVLTQGLVDLADRLAIHLTISCHIRKPMEQGKARRIVLKDIRGSSQIGDSGKWIAAIQNQDEKFKLDVIESNHGPPDWVEVRRLTGPERFEELNPFGNKANSNHSHATEQDDYFGAG